MFYKSYDCDLFDKGKAKIAVNEKKNKKRIVWTKERVLGHKKLEYGQFLVTNRILRCE